MIIWIMEPFLPITLGTLLWQILEISHSKVPRVIGKNGSMIQMIKNYTNCRIFIGQNGRIWVDGNMDDMVHAMRAIKMIEEGAQTLKLTERVKEFLDSVYRKEE